VTGLLLFVLIHTTLPKAPEPGVAHFYMGFLFGVSHLAYGLYLHFTETKAKAT
jgi:hypothetical protein